MIEINFLEKKKQNAVPILLISIGIICSLVLVSGMALYRSRLSDEHTGLLAEINQNEIRMSELEQISHVSHQLANLESQIDQLEENLFPTLYIKEEVASLLPESETTQVFDYQFSIQDGLVLHVQLQGMDQVAELKRVLSEQAYFRSVTLENVVLINEFEELHEVTFEVEVDRDHVIRAEENDI